MNITVTKNQVSVNTDYILNDKEYNVNQCYFTFSDEYTDDLVKKAIFVQGTSTIEMSIINNQCQIPAEVLNNGQFELRVYAYEVDGDELLLRYSPSYTTAYVRTGSYIENAESPEVITPTQFEQYMQAMNDGLNEVANVDIDAEQLDNGMSVTITNRYGEDKTVYAYDGEKGETGATPNIQIGTVVTGNNSEVTRTGTNENPIFNFVLEKGDKGDTGNGIASVTKTSTSGLVDTYTITFTNGTTTTFDVTNGKGISSISKTSTSGLTDTYTITYNDNTTSSFTVTNGNGISSIEKTATQDNIDTYTIYYTNGTTSIFTVTNSTVTDQEFEELQERTEYLGKYSNALIKQNSSGTDLTINDTAECPMPIVLSPSELSQVTTTGKNILVPAFQTDTKSQITCTYTSNGWLLNGTYSGSETQTWFKIFDEELSAGTYCINGITGGSSSTFQLVIRKDDSVLFYLQSTDKTFTLTESAQIDMRLYAYSAYGTFNNLLLPYQLETGSTATPYEPYTGKKASPNPDYPQDIHVVTGSNKMTVSNSNLFDVNKRLTGAIAENGDIYWTARKVPFYEYNFKENTSYTIFGYFKTSGAGSGRIGITYTDGTTDNASLNTNNATEYTYKKVVTPSNKTIDYIGTIYGSNGTTYIKGNTLMIAEGDVSNYVPYEENNYSIDLGAINLFDKDNATYRDGYIKNDNGEETTSSVSGYINSYVEVKPNTKYTINGKITDSNNYWRVYFYDSSKNWISRTDQLNLGAIPYTFTTPNNCYYIQFQYKISAYDADTIQIEKGEIAGAYAPYGQPSLEYCKIGNYSDMFFKNTTDSEYYDSTLQLNKWYLKKNIGKLVLDGSENWDYNSNNLFFYIAFSQHGDRINSYCNYYKYVSADQLANVSYGYAFTTNSLRIKNTDYTNTTDFENWLASNNTTIYYVNKNTTYTLLNDTLQAELEQIYNWLLSYQDQTNISQTNYDLPFVINATTCYDLNKLLTRVEILESEEV